MGIRIPPVLRIKPTGCMAAVGDKNSLDLFVREEEWGMKKYPGRFPIELRLVTWDDERVLLIALLVRLNCNDHTTLDTWINAGEPAGVRLMQAICAHPTLNLHFVTQSEVLRSIRHSNTVQSAATEVLQSPTIRRTWSADDFKRARDQINVLYPTASALWWSKICQSARPSLRKSPAESTRS